MSTAEVLNTDCLDALRDMPDASVDAIVTDPPYGLSNTTPAQVAETITQWVTGDREYLPTGRGFMGHEWDGFVPPVAVWDECLRVLKPGGHLLAFAGSRTHDLMTLGIRLAGFEIRDSIAWLHAQGFPKAKSQLKPAHEPITLARKPPEGSIAANVLEHGTGALNIDACRIYATDDDRALMEARSHPNGTKAGSSGGGIAMQLDKPHGFKSHPSGRWPANVVLDESQAAELDRQSGNVKTGATKPHRRDPDSDPMFKVGKWMTHSQPASEGGASRFFYIARKDNECPSGQSSSTVSTAEMSSSGEGQPPASALNGAATSERHDTGRQTGSPSTSETQNGSKPNATTDTPTTPTIESASSPERQHASTTLTRNPANSAEPNPQTDTMTTTTSHLKSAGSAESATSSTTQKSKELGDMGLGDSSRFMYCAKAPKSERPVVDGVAHSTVKPVTLMKWLVRMVTPPGGTVLDPFAGSGTTLEAAMLEGFNVIGIEREADYLPLIQARIDRATAELEAQAEADADTLFPIDGAAS